MDIANWENFASNHIDDVVLSSQVMAAKAYLASFAESSVNTNSQTLDLIFHYNTFSNLSASIFRNIKTVLDCTNSRPVPASTTSNERICFSIN